MTVTREANIEDLNTLSEHILKFIRNYEKKNNKDDINKGYLDMLYKWMRTIDAVYNSIKRMDRYETWQKINEEINAIVERDPEVGEVIIKISLSKKKGLGLMDATQHIDKD